jgi:hypothetical protein
LTPLVPPSHQVFPLAHRTHGTYRPTLLPLLRQNPAPLIISTTRTAFSQLPDLPTAITTLTKPLKGIGPATATLILSVYDPNSIPFFSDELYAWLVSPAAAHNGSTPKLKYDMKEYFRLHEAWLALRARLVEQGMEEGEVSAAHVEKVAYVLARWEMLSPQERWRVFHLGGDKLKEEKVEGEQVEGERGEEEEKEPAAAVAGKRRVKPRENDPGLKKAGRNRKESLHDDADANETGVRRSKRLKTTWRRRRQQQ